MEDIDFYKYYDKIRSNASNKLTITKEFFENDPRITDEFSALNIIFKDVLSHKGRVEYLSETTGENYVYFEINQKNYSNLVNTKTICVVKDFKPLFILSSYMNNTEGDCYSDNTVGVYGEDGHLFSKLRINKIAFDNISDIRVSILDKHSVSDVEYAKSEYEFYFNGDKVMVFKIDDEICTSKSLKLESALNHIEVIKNKIDTYFDEMVKEEEVKPYIIKRKNNSKKTI